MTTNRQNFEEFLGGVCVSRNALGEEAYVSRTAAKALALDAVAETLFECKMAERAEAQ